MNPKVTVEKRTWHPAFGTALRTFMLMVLGACGGAEFEEEPVEDELASSAQDLTSTPTLVFSAENAPAVTPRMLFGTSFITLPVTAPGQTFYLESKITVGKCTSVQACEVALEIKCWAGVPRKSARVGAQVWSAGNYVQNAPDKNYHARMIYTSTSSARVNCQTELYYSDHGTHISGDSLTVRPGSTFRFAGPLANTLSTPSSGGNVRLSASSRTAALQQLGTWTQTGSSVSYIADVQATECHVNYPRDAATPGSPHNDSSKWCTASKEAGSNTVLQLTALAVELYPNGRICQITYGATTQTTITPAEHHKMIYTAVKASHTRGCAGKWRFNIYAKWISGRSVAISGGPYGQGMVRPL